MKKIEVVAGIIINEDYYLCCQRPKNRLIYLSEKWEFPGGKIEDGESLEQTLVREIKEELDMDVNNYEYALTVSHEYTDFELTMHVFNVYSEKREFKLNSHIDAFWANLEDLNRFDWAAADLPIVQYIMNQNK